MENRKELKVGIFVLGGVGLVILSIFMLGGVESLFRKATPYHSYFQAVDGLVPGAKVVLNGIRVGVVKNFDFSPERGTIEVHYDVDNQYQRWIRQGSLAEIATQGVLGDKYISITAGPPEADSIASGAEIPMSPTRDFTQIMNKSDQLMKNLNSITTSMDHILKAIEAQNRTEFIMQNLSATSKNFAAFSSELNQAQLKNSINHLNEILRKIDQGTGTLGALVNDPSLYDDVKALFGGANRNRVIRNLVRDTVNQAEKKN